jgi:sugar lactone lactonase YvrE
MGQRFGRARSTVGLVVTALVAAGIVPLVTAGPASALTPLHGVVNGDGAPRQDYDVTLYATNGTGSPAVLGTDTTDGAGVFDIAYTAPTDSHAVLYLLARSTELLHPNGEVTLASVLGTGSAPPNAVVDELTTVAAAYAMTQFTSNGNISGLSPGLQNAAGMVGNLVDPVTGAVSSVLANPPNVASSLETFNALANMVSQCIALGCAVLFTQATPPGGPAPTDTFQALVDINHNPWQNVPALFALSLLGGIFTPTRASAPDAWTLALRFVGDGVSMDGPGNMAVDHEGNLWVTNNYEFSPDVLPPVCGAKNLLEFTPTGKYVPGSPWTGGGLSGAGFGVAIDPYGDIWVANFGFAAPPPDCPDIRQPPHNSVSQFHPDGTPVSPSSTNPSGTNGGFTQGDISWPQGTVADKQANIWIVNCLGDSVTVFPNGNANAAREITNFGVSEPFGAALDASGNVFVTGNASSNLAVLQPNGVPAPGSPVDLGPARKPLGVAVDENGYAWVANSGLVGLPCPLFDVTPTFGSISLVPPGLGSAVNFSGGGLTVPWGITTDGSGIVWVANFASKRLSQFCGTNTAACPPGLATGDNISPDVTGYGFDGLSRNTGVVVDQAGNVWLANNWKEDAVQTNPGGYEMVAFVGMATPVQVPTPRARPVPALDFTG